MSFDGLKFFCALSLVLSVFANAAPVMAEKADIIGVWSHDTGKEKYKIIVAEEEEDTFLIKKFENGIMMREVVVEARRDDGIVYRPVDDDSEVYYLVDEFGNLQIWDALGIRETIRADK